jgi:xanthine dehydrogenase YagR molybdenum-binding subunit
VSRETRQGAVGRAIDRVDGRSKVTGEATFAADVEVARVAHAVIVGSAIARGRITSIETRAAETAPGVLTVLTHRNAPQVPAAPGEGKGPGDRVLQILQDNKIVYSDQPIALVVADSLERAQHAAHLVAARYDADPALADVDADLANSYRPKTAGPGQQPDSSRGDVDAGLRSASIVDQTYTTPVETHNPMEPHATIAVWHGDERLTLYDSTQGIFGVRKRLAAVFGLAPEQVRVINHFVGGGFGCKGSPWSHVVLAAMAARVVRRPVKLVVTRQQMFSLVGHRPRTVQRVALAAGADGRLTGIRHDVVAETSRFDEFVEGSAVTTRLLYACPNVSTTHRLVRVDAPTPTFTRAPGVASGTFALESAMDELAYQLRIDPVELRLRNHADVDPDSGKPWSSKSLRACYRRAAERFGWSRRNPAVRSRRDGRALIGWGMASATYPARQMPASARARLRADGSALVQAGTQDIGTGTYTIMTQIAADALALPVGAVQFELGDTVLPETPLSAGSFTASSTGSAVKMACLELQKELVRLATGDPRSPLHQLEPESIEARDGALVARGGSRRDPYSDIVHRSGQPEIRAEFKTEEKPERKKYASHAFGAQFAEVRVDRELGQIQVTRYVAAFAAGKILNPKTARSQFLGGIVWGIGLALQEHTARDRRTARAVTRDLVDYHVPVNADVPDIDIVMVDEDDPYVNEIGAKGVGEIGITGAGAAIANAVYHATGIRVRDLPITLDKLL